MMPDLRAAWPAGMSRCFVRPIKHLADRIRRARHHPASEPWLAQTTRFAGFRYCFVWILTKLLVLGIKITIPAESVSPGPVGLARIQGVFPRLCDCTGL